MEGKDKIKGGEKMLKKKRNRKERREGRRGRGRNERKERLKKFISSRREGKEF